MFSGFVCLFIFRHGIFTGVYFFDIFLYYLGRLQYDMDLDV